MPSESAAPLESKGWTRMLIVTAKVVTINIRTLMFIGMFIVLRQGARLKVVPSKR